MNLRDLHEEFPRDRITWRPQGSMSKTGKILALAYIDARDVMDRLDSVCGPENWQDSYVETLKGRVLCTISLRIGGEWISKSDGAGETQVEGEKGAISDALKRAAVKWGVGRYLYDIKSPWVPCETYKGNDGKDKFSKFSVDPWTLVRGPAPQPVQRPVEPPHDPETGEVRSAPDHSATMETDSAGLAAWKDGVFDALPPNADTKTKASALARQFITDLDKYKAETWLERYIASRRPVIDWLEGDEDLRRDLHEAMAAARGRVRGEDPRDFAPIGSEAAR